jgi:hypothetical protein
MHLWIRTFFARRPISPFKRGELVSDLSPLRAPPSHDTHRVNQLCGEAYVKGEADIVAMAVRYGQGGIFWILLDPKPWTLNLEPVIESLEPQTPTLDSKP